MLPTPPEPYQDFVERFPRLARAWEELGIGAREAGPLDDRVATLVKLGLSVGAGRRGAVHAAVRRAIAHGIDDAAIYQVVALAASTIGLPGSVAAYTWVRDVIRERDDEGSDP